MPSNAPCHGCSVLMWLCAFPPGPTGAKLPAAEVEPIATILGPELSVEVCLNDGKADPEGAARGLSSRK